jgi:hypothetical protein
MPAEIRMKASAQRALNKEKGELLWWRSEP